MLGCLFLTLEKSEPVSEEAWGKYGKIKATDRAWPGNQRSAEMSTLSSLGLTKDQTLSRHKVCKIQKIHRRALQQYETSERGTTWKQL